MTTEGRRLSAEEEERSADSGGGEVFMWISGELCGCRALEQIMAERDE
jgi:hypothetical protein